MNTLDTVRVWGVVPMQCSAARTVSAVVFDAPPTNPSASPAATINDAKYNGSWAIRPASVWLTPRDRRRS